MKKSYFFKLITWKIVSLANPPIVFYCGGLVQKWPSKGCYVCASILLRRSLHQWRSCPSWKDFVRCWWASSTLMGQHWWGGRESLDLFRPATSWSWSFPVQCSRYYYLLSRKWQFKQNIGYGAKVSHFKFLGFK